MLKRLGKIVVLGAVAGSMQLAFAARQCLALPGTYGAVTVTGCENDPANGVINPISTLIPDYPNDGLALGQLGPSPATCTYGFSHSILTSSVTIDLDVIQAGDILSIELDGQPYAFTNGDIVQSPIANALSQNVITTTGGTVTVANPAQLGSGQVQLLSGGPQRFSSMKLTMAFNNQGLGGVSRVCVDDAAAVVPPTQTATPVPATSTWGLMALGSLMGLAGIVGFSRRRKQ